MDFNWRGARPKQGPKQGPKRRGHPLLRHTARHIRAACAAIALGLPPAAAPAAALPAGTRSVPLDMQDLVEAAIAPQLVLPQTARWQFEFTAPYDEGGDLVCGSVNYQSAMRVYLGPQRFYAIIKDGVVKRSQLQDPPYVDPTGAEAERFKVLCDRK